MLHLVCAERALLADEMGLGKIVQAVAACALLQRLRRVERVLIVTPPSLQGEWEEQIARFTRLPSRILNGTRQERLAGYERSRALFFTIASYESMLADALDVNERLRPDVVILDEAQRIKNWGTKTALAVKRLRGRYAWVLTGTPIENRIDELYSLVSFLEPAVFGPLFRFNREFYEFDERGRPRGYRNLDELRRRIRPLLLRRRKADVQTELPQPGGAIFPRSARRKPTGRVSAARSRGQATVDRRPAPGRDRAAADARFAGAEHAAHDLRQPISARPRRPRLPEARRVEPPARGVHGQLRGESGDLQRVGADAGAGGWIVRPAAPGSRHPHRRRHRSATSPVGRTIPRRSGLPGVAEHRWRGRRAELPPGERAHQLRPALESGAPGTKDCPRLAQGSDQRGHGPQPRKRRHRRTPPARDFWLASRRSATGCSTSAAT